MTKSTKTKDSLEKLLKKKFKNRRPTKQELEELKEAYKDGKLKHDVIDVAKELIKDLKE